MDRRRFLQSATCLFLDVEVEESYIISGFDKMGLIEMARCDLLLISGRKNGAMRSDIDQVGRNGAAFPCQYTISADAAKSLLDFSPHQPFQVLGPESDNL